MSMGMSKKMSDGVYGLWENKRTYDKTRAGPEGGDVQKAAISRSQKDGDFCRPFGLTVWKRCSQHADTK